MPVNIVARRVWCHSRPTDPLRLDKPVPYVVSHGVATPECHTDSECRALVRRLVDPKRGDTIYSFLIGGNGWVYESSGFIEAPQLYKVFSDQSTRAVYIGLLGHYREWKPEIMIETRQALIDYGVRMGMIDPQYTFLDQVVKPFVIKPSPKQKNPFFMNQKIYPSPSVND